MLLGLQVDELGDALRCRVHIEQIIGFLQLLKRRQDRVVFMQDHLVIEVVVDPRLHHPFDLAEIDDHAQRIELIALNSNDRRAIVPVQMPAFAAVIQQAMTVTKVDFASNSMHGVRIQKPGVSSQNTETGHGEHAGVFACSQALWYRRFYSTPILVNNA
jgi:hypothetical protein